MSLKTIYDRSAELDQNYDHSVFRSDRVLQSAELNEMQTSMRGRIKSIADAIFKNGDLIRDARLIVNPETGLTNCEAGALYLAGAVRGVKPAEFTIPVVGVVTIGVYLNETLVTELEDPALLNPAVGTRGYREPGAARMRIEPVWGVAGQPGQFYPVYVVEDGYVRAKEPPPQIDAVTQALARYDRDSAGGSYVVSGLTVSQSADTPAGDQVYTINQGRARVAGYAISLQTGRRFVVTPSPDLQRISDEPHVSVTENAQRINVDRTPVEAISRVSITAQKTVTVLHGSFSGVIDPLPDNAILAVLSVFQGAKTFNKDADYKLTAGQIDWTPNGAEPATGSTYKVTYQYITEVAPEAVDGTGFTVTGAVPGSLVRVSYAQMLPRIDRLCIDQEGRFEWIRGVAAAWQPKPPIIAGNLLPIATIYQNWTASRVVQNDAVRMVPMQDLVHLGERIDRVIELLAQQRLESDINLREAGAKKGLFVDPFTSDNLRDQGVQQSAAIVNGELTLSVSAPSVNSMSHDVATPATLAYDLVPVLEQTLRTGSMAVNPYMAFDPLPAEVTLTPAVDQWSNISTQWASPVTQWMQSGPTIFTSDRARWGTTELGRTSSVDLVSSVQKPDEFLRRIEISFKATGFGPGEIVKDITFDDLPVNVN